MSLNIRMADQVLRVEDTRESTEAVVHKHDAFLNVLCPGAYAFQHDAVRTAWRFLVSDRYPDLEQLARENWNAREVLRQRHARLEDMLARMPLRDRKAASLDLATGTGKSYVMYALAMLALAEGLVDRVLVLCPSLTIEEGLLAKFRAFSADPNLTAILRELGAAVAIPGIRRGSDTVEKGDICVENIHAVYANAGSSIADSFRGRGARTLVLNDEAHHLFNQEDKGPKEWLKFLLNPAYGFRYLIHVTGTPFVGDDYFPDVLHRFGLKQAIEAGIVKKPDYKVEDTYTDHDWQRTLTVHERNREKYGGKVKPITIVVTQEIAACLEVWRELVEFLAGKEKIPRDEAARKCLWVVSGLPSGKVEKERIAKAFLPRKDDDTPEKQRKDNLAALRHVDELDSPVEWIVSVSMLTEGWDVKNVFQIVPHETRAFNSKLLIAQVLGRGLRVPASLANELPLVTINNHEKWSPEIANLLQDVLEVENSLSWGFLPGREAFTFPLHNLRYQPVLKTIEIKRERARAPKVNFQPQQKVSSQTMRFSATGQVGYEIEHKDWRELGDAVRLLHLFIREKDAELAQTWTKAKLKKWIVDGLTDAGQDPTFLSHENLLRVQYGFSPMFRPTGNPSPRLEQEAGDLETVDMKTIPGQSFSESALKTSGAVRYAAEVPTGFRGAEAGLWKQYQSFRKQFAEYGSDAAPQAQEIGKRIQEIPLGRFKTPWTLHYASHEPERRFSDLLFEHADLFAAFVKMPDRNGYAFPYSYKPAKAGKTHTANKMFHPDFFIRVADSHAILVVEIKEEGDDSNQNRAKYRDGKRHFGTLNDKLTQAGEPWRYHFYFLSPEDYAAFFQAVRECRFQGWKSGLMTALEAGDD